MNNDRNIYTYDEFRLKYNINTTKQEFNQIRRSVVRYMENNVSAADNIWSVRPKIDFKSTIFKFRSGTTIDIANAKCKQFYREFLLFEASDATALWKWKDNYKIEEQTFYDSMVQAHKSTKEPKLISFQFKILHNIVNNGSNLLKWKIRDTNLCEMCKNAVDTIVHELTNCKTTVDILKKLSEETAIGHLFRNLSKRELIFGCNKTAKNHILLIVKYVIHISRQNQFPFSLKVLYSEIYKRIIVDKQQLNPTAFNRKWKELDILCKNALEFVSQYRNVPY